jgi:hypothetical protein
MEKFQSMWMILILENEESTIINEHLVQIEEVLPSDYLEIIEKEIKKAKKTTTIFVMENILYLILKYLLQLHDQLFLWI